jgi:hypothetical protein
MSPNNTVYNSRLGDSIHSSPNDACLVRTVIFIIFNLAKRRGRGIGEGGIIGAGILDRGHTRILEKEGLKGLFFVSA